MIHQHLIKRKLKYFIYPSFAFLALFLFFAFGRKPPEDKDLTNTVSVVRTIEAVAALGYLSPSGEIRMLAAPTSGLGGTPRIQRLFIEEGVEVKKGQVLAVFDNKSRILADLEISKARLEIIENNLRFQKREISRYEESVSQGASPQILLDEKNDILIQILGKKKEILAEIKGLEVELFDSQLRSPIDGTILKINVREGERSGLEGVLEIGSNHKMEALIEVYESDIDRVSLGQKVSLISENGGFDGTLDGEVRQISPQIRQRRVLATDPTGDADARIVEVRIRLDSSSSIKVKSFTGMKVIAKFEPR